MRAITFNQALLAVALLGLTLVIALGATSVPQIIGARSGFGDSGIGPSTTAAILLQAEPSSFRSWSSPRPACSDRRTAPTP